MAQCFTLSVFYHFPKCDPHVTNSRHCGAHHWHRNGPYSGWQVFIKLSWKHTRVRLRLRLHWKGPSVSNYSKTHHPTFSKSPPLWIDLGEAFVFLINDTDRTLLQLISPYPTIAPPAVVPLHVFGTNPNLRQCAYLTY